MQLTDYKKRMLEGEHGELASKCLQVLVTIGDIYGADKMLEINNVHSPGVSYRAAGDAGLSYVQIPAKWVVLDCIFSNWLIQVFHNKLGSIPSYS